MHMRLVRGITVAALGHIGCQDPSIENPCPDTSPGPFGAGRITAIALRAEGRGGEIRLLPKQEQSG